MATTGGEGTIECPAMKDPLPPGTFPRVSEREEVSIEVSGLCDDIEGMGLMQTVDVELRHPATAPQDLGTVLHPQGAQLCVHDNFMRTIRLPLSSFCAERHSLRAVQLTFGLPGTASSGRILVDSLELTSSPFDAADACP